MDALRPNLRGERRIICGEDLPLRGLWGCSWFSRGDIEGRMALDGTPAKGKREIQSKEYTLSTCRYALIQYLLVCTIYHAQLRAVLCIKLLFGDSGCLKAKEVQFVPSPNCSMAIEHTHVLEPWKNFQPGGRWWPAAGRRSMRGTLCSTLTRNVV